MSTAIITPVNPATNPVNGVAAIKEFAVPNRDLVDLRSTRNQSMGKKLEDVRDHLRKLHALQDPEDHERPASQLAVFFQDGEMTGRFLTPGKGLGDEVYTFSAHGATQLAQMVLPSGFFRGLKSFVHIDDEAKKLASLVWNKSAQQAHNPILMRTVRYKDRSTGEVRRMIRSAHSTGYGAYSNLEYVQTLLDNGSDLVRNSDVLEFRVTDELMRIRVAADVVTTEKPVRMVELWNSEVGLRRIALKSGLYKLVCTNGMGHWDSSLEHSWIHRGSSKRISDRVDSAIKGAVTDASGIMNSYELAVNIAIDNMFDFMTHRMNSMGATATQIANATKLLDDPTNTPGSTLATVVDAITLSAQKESLFVQSHLEEMAGKILYTGVRSAKNNMLSVN